MSNSGSLMVYRLLQGGQTQHRACGTVWTTSILSLLSSPEHSHICSCSQWLMHWSVEWYYTESTRENSRVFHFREWEERPLCTLRAEQTGSSWTSSGRSWLYVFSPASSVKETASLAMSTGKISPPALPILFSHLIYRVYYAVKTCENLPKIGSLSFFFLCVTFNVTNVPWNRVSTVKSSMQASENITVVTCILLLAQSIIQTRYRLIWSMFKRCQKRGDN